MLPSFVIVLLIVHFYTKFYHNRIFEGVLSALRPCGRRALQGVQPRFAVCQRVLMVRRSIFSVSVNDDPLMVNIDFRIRAVRIQDFKRRIVRFQNCVGSVRIGRFNVLRRQRRPCARVRSGGFAENGPRGCHLCGRRQIFKIGGNRRCWLVRVSSLLDPENNAQRSRDGHIPALRVDLRAVWENRLHASVRRVIRQFNCDSGSVREYPQIIGRRRVVFVWFLHRSLGGYIVAGGM